jgi:hypothetical protein
MNAFHQHLSAIVAMVALAALGGCATGYHYSQIDGYRYYKAPIDTHPLLITKVDGVSTPLSTPVQVEPGLRHVGVQTYPGKFDSLGTEKTIDLEVKPCTHYYLVGVKPNALLRDYEVKVEYQEPVPGCTAPAAQ